MNFSRQMNIFNIYLTLKRTWNMLDFWKAFLKAFVERFKKNLKNPTPLGD